MELTQKQMASKGGSSKSFKKQEAARRNWEKAALALAQKRLSQKGSGQRLIKPPNKDAGNG